MAVIFINARIKPKYIERRFIIVKGLNESLNIILSLQDLSSFIYIHATISIEL